MKLIEKSNFELFYEYSTAEEKEMLDGFFERFEMQCDLGRSDKRRMRKDFENALLYYHAIGFPLSKSIDLIDPKYLGGFYARPSMMWYALDDSAKIYPISIGHGVMSVFRLSAYMKDDIVPELLQLALTFTIKRFPSFATSLKKGVFWHYLDTVKRRFVIEEEYDVPCRPLKVSLTGSITFRVLYYKKRISVEFFHVVTDGTGGMNFLKVLLTEYLRLTGVEINNDGSVWDINETPSAKEISNEFSNVPLTEKAGGLGGKPVVQMSGRISKITPCRMLHFKMDTNTLKEVAKRYNVTVTNYLICLMFLAIAKATEQVEGDVVVQVPVNMRKFYPSTTLRNFSLYGCIKINLKDITDMESLTKEVSTQLVEKTSKEKMSEMNTNAHKLVRSIRFLPLVIKQPIAKAVYGILGDKVFTTVISNLGVVQMPKECSEYIDYMDFGLGTALTNRASCSVVTYGNITTFTIAKRTLDPTFEEKMYDLLTNDGIEIDAEGSAIYEN